MVNQTKILVAVYCLCFVLFISCDDKKASARIAVVDIESNVFNLEDIFLSDYVVDIKYIPIEKNKDLLINPNSFQATFNDEYILGYDSKMCLLYDRNGNLIRAIGQQGRGPGEYSYIAGIVDIKDETIFISDFLKLIEYRINGEHISDNKAGLTIAEKYYLQKEYIINDSLIIGNIDNSTGTDEYKALLIDMDGNILKTYKNYIFFKLDQGVNRAQSPGSAFFYEFENRLYFKEFLNDTLFQLNEDYQLVPEYVFDLGKFKLPVSDRGKSWSELDLSSCIDIQFVYQTKDHLFIVSDYAKYFPAKRLTPKKISMPSGNEITMWENTTRMLGVYEKETGELAFAEPSNTDNLLFSSGFYNDIDAGPRFLPTNIVNDSTMAMRLDFYDLLDHVESDDFKNNIPKNPEQKEKLAALIDSLKQADFDNPVYMLVTFRN